MTEDRFEEVNPEEIAPTEDFGELTPEDYANSYDASNENLFILNAKGRQRFNEMRKKLMDDLPDFNNLPNV